MKKSMTRLLSLALVLIMLVGMVPAVLAAEGEGSLTIGTSDSKLEYSLKQDGTKVTAQVNSTVVAPDGYLLTSYQWFGEEPVTAGTIAPLTLEAEGKEEKVFNVSLSATFTEKTPENPAPEFEADVKTLTSNALIIKFVPYTAPEKKPVTVSMPSEVKVVLGDKPFKLDLKIEGLPEGVKAEEVLDVQWGPENSEFADVNSTTGEVTPKKAGSFDLVAAVNINEPKQEEYELTHTEALKCKVTISEKLLTVVVDGGNKSAPIMGSLTLKASLKGDEAMVKEAEKGKLTYIFENVTTKTTTKSDDNTVTLTSKDAGVVETKVSITYTVGGKEFTTEPVTVFNSFYDGSVIKVTASKSTFQFGESGILTQVDDNGLEYKPEGVKTVALSNLIRPEDGYYYTVTETSRECSVTYDKKAVTNLHGGAVDDITFSAVEEKDVYVIKYDVLAQKDKTYLKVQAGTLEISCATGGNVEYKTDKKTVVEFDEDDFMDFWYKEKKNRKLSYVEFNVVKNQFPQHGSLYETASQKDLVSSKSKYYFGATSTQDDLDDIVYVPAKDVTTTYYTVNIPFTAYDKDGSSLGGIVKITVEDGGDIVYKTTPNKAVSLDEDDFRTFYNKEKLNKYGDFTYVVFDSDKKGDPKMGALFVDGTTNAENVDRDMRFIYHYNKKDHEGKFNYDLDEVTYVPFNLADEPYVDYVAFTCYGKNENEAVRGVLAFEVGVEMPFKDVSKKDWFYEDVEYVFSNDIMNGTDKTTFSPNATLTRSMVVTMLWRIEDEPAVHATGLFKDVKKNEWYTDAVEWAAKEKIVNGYGDKFGPADNITRQDLAVILYRYYTDYKENKDYSNVSLTKFTDYKQVAEYAEDALEWAVDNKIMQGDAGKLMPKGNATRAQAAAMFHRFLEMD